MQNMGATVAEATPGPSESFTCGVFQTALEMELGIRHPSRLSHGATPHPISVTHSIISISGLYRTVREVRTAVPVTAVPA